LVAAIEKSRHLAAHENARMDREGGWCVFAVSLPPIRNQDCGYPMLAYQHSARDSNEGRNIE
jgi:hypothetical protein